MEQPLTKNIRPGQEPLFLKDYEKAGGYQSVRKALALSPQDVQNIVKASNLRGRGGAGFPTGMKWSFVPMGPAARRPKYFVVNADEMEPGTFKDRLLLEGDPHQIVEGVIVSAYAIEAEQAFIFIRWAYKHAIKRLQHAIAEAYANNYLGKNIFGRDTASIFASTAARAAISAVRRRRFNARPRRQASHTRAKPLPQVWTLRQATIVNNPRPS
jgi:NADH-quinone oxidoreductase subunit F